MENLNLNDIITVKITSLRDYGALVLAENGQKGLLHISEISPFYVSNISDFVKENDDVRVKVIEIDSNSGFFKVSLKQLVHNPKRQKRHAQYEHIDENEIDFSPLKAMLPQWIKNAKEQTHD